MRFRGFAIYFFAAVFFFGLFNAMPAMGSGDRHPAFWPENLQPPFSSVTDRESTGVISIMGTFFDPLIATPKLPADLTLTPEKNPIEYVIVQYPGPVTEKLKAITRSFGLEPLVYLEHFAFICRQTSDADTSRAVQSGIFRWIGTFEPAYRISPSVGKIKLKLPERVNDPMYHLVVTLFEGASMPDLTQEVLRIKGEILEQVNSPYRQSLIIRLNPKLIPELSKYQGIFRIEEQGEYFAFNDETQEVVQSGSVAGGLPIWNHGLHGENQIIGVMDSGVDPDHCFFYDSSSPYSFSSSHRKIVAYRTYGTYAVQYDLCTDGHGTHVAGTAAGYPDNGASYIQYRGIAYNAKLTVADIGRDTYTDCNVTGAIFPPSDLTAAYQDALNDGAYIHTNSWGGSTNEYNSYCTDADDFMWDNKNFLILFAAGNDGPSAETVSYPGTAKNIICVGGSDNEPNQEDMYNSSSRGPALTSNRMRPDLTAPATDTSGGSGGIDSAASDGDTTGRNCSIVGGFSGTSMACPAVAGSAALVRQYYTAGYYPSGAANAGDGFTPTAALMKATLINSTHNMTGDPTVRPSNDQGFGRVLLDDALYFSGDASGLYVEDDTTGVATSGLNSYPVTITSNSQPLKVTLVWTDRDGDSLVNDLDLELTNGTTTWYGNNFTSGWSNTGTTRDHTNPTECIFLNSGTFTTGTYTVRVRGYSVAQGEPGGRQPYAMVLTGVLGDIPTPEPTPTVPTSTPTPIPDEVDLFLMDNDCSAPSTNFAGLCNPSSDSISVTTGDTICHASCSPEDDCRIGWIYDTESNQTYWHYYFTPVLTLDCPQNVQFDMCYGFDGWSSGTTYYTGNFRVYWRCADSTTTIDCNNMSDTGLTGGDWTLGWEDATEWGEDCAERTVTGEYLTIPCSCDSIEVMVAMEFDGYADAAGIAQFRVYYSNSDSPCAVGERNCVGPTATPEPSYTPTTIPSNTPTAIPSDTPTAIPSDTPTAMPTDTATPLPTDIPTFTPTSLPTDLPTTVPTAGPTAEPTPEPTETPPVQAIPATGPLGLGLLLTLLGAFLSLSIRKSRR